MDNVQNCDRYTIVQTSRSEQHRMLFMNSDHREPPVAYDSPSAYSS
jgi:hypothetical protein